VQVRHHDGWIWDHATVPHGFKTAEAADAAMAALSDTPREMMVSVYGEDTIVLLCCLQTPGSGDMCVVGHIAVAMHDDPDNDPIVLAIVIQIMIPIVCQYGLTAQTTGLYCRPHQTGEGH